MASASDEEFATACSVIHMPTLKFSERGPRVIPFRSERGKIDKDINLGNRRCGLPQTRSLRGDGFAHLPIEATFDFDDAFVGFEDFALVILQFRRSEALCVHECLFPSVIGGCQMLIRFRYFDVITEHTVEAYFQGSNSSALPFAVLHRSNCLLRRLA